jgi:hypothetical protein
LAPCSGDKPRRSCSPRQAPGRFAFRASPVSSSLRLSCAAGKPAMRLSAVDVFFRVSRPQVAGVLVPSLRSRPWPLDPVLTVFPAVASPTVAGRVCSPRELASLPQRLQTWCPASPRCSDAPPSSVAQSGGCTPSRAPLLRFDSPSALESSGVHSVPDPKVGSRPEGRPAAALPQPLSSVLAVSTASTACSAICSCPGFPAQHSWGSYPSGLFPVCEDRAVSGAVFPSWPSLVRSCLRSRSRFHRTSGPPGVCSAPVAEAPGQTDRGRQRLVSRAPGLDPSWALFRNRSLGRVPSRWYSEF